MKTAVRVLLPFFALALAGCGTSTFASTQAAATKGICTARADATNNVNSILNEVASPGTPVDVLTTLAALRNDVIAVNTNARALPPPLRAQVVRANLVFFAQFQRLAPAFNPRAVQNWQPSFLAARQALAIANQNVSLPITC